MKVEVIEDDLSTSVFTRTLPLSYNTPSSTHTHTNIKQVRFKKSSWRRRDELWIVFATFFVSEEMLR